MPIALEIAIGRERSRRSGIIGLSTWASMTRNTASSTAAAASRPSVRGLLQPASLPPTIA